MRALTVRAADPQEQVIWQGESALVHFDERTETRTEEDGSETTQYLYVGVVVPNAKQYVDVVGAARKAARNYAVDNMLIEHNGHIWQADEISQGRLIRQREMMIKLNMDTAEWKHIHNVFVPITLDDIEQILLKAGEEQTRIWKLYG